jgi:hypothetical protein
MIISISNSTMKPKVSIRYLETPNAQITGLKLFVKILRDEKQQTVLSPSLFAC